MEKIAIFVAIFYDPGITLKTTPQTLNSDATIGVHEKSIFEPM